MKAISAGIAGKVSVAIVSAILGEGKEGEVGGSGGQAEGGRDQDASTRRAFY